PDKRSQRSGRYCLHKFIFLSLLTYSSNKQQQTCTPGKDITQRRSLAVEKSSPSVGMYTIFFTNLFYKKCEK
ncbi:MAG: hypothetical protein ACOC4L_02900, partial [Halanaerobium sp.]